MEVIEILDDENYGLLGQKELSEITKLLNGYFFYVSPEKSEEFRTKVEELVAKHKAEKEKITRYSREEYERIIQSRAPSFEEEPVYKLDILEGKTKNEVVDLIEEYFDRECFDKNREELMKGIAQKKEEVKENIELDVMMSMSKKQLNGFLSMIGYYQRRFGFFITSSDTVKICKKYRREVLVMNPGLENEKSQPYYVFGKWGRVPDGYIDIDKPSYQELISPYLKENAEQLVEVLRIYKKGGNPTPEQEIEYQEADSKRKKELTWEFIKEGVYKYLMDCRRKGVMKELN